MYLWMFILPLLILFACWGWLFLSRRWSWVSPLAEDQIIQDQEGPELQEQSGGRVILEDQNDPKNWSDLLFRARWLVGLLIVLLILVIYIFLFAPPRLGEQIPIHHQQSGRPFYSLHWLRDFVENYYYVLEVGTTLLGCLVSLVTLVIAHFRKWRFAGEMSLLFISLTLAFWGQWLLNFEVEYIGVIIYVIAIIGFASWAWLARKRIYLTLLPHSPDFQFKEWLLVLGVFGIAVFARFYALSSIPYGAEGDEVKWVYEVVQLMVDGKSDSSGEYHRDALPLSFYMQAPFQQLLEPGIYSARLGVVFYSLLATLAFYWLIRQLAPVPLALLSTFLLSISIMDISASRLANVESHVKLWPILALALLASAVRKNRWELYLLSGLAFAFGLLTYDTVWPIFFVVILLVVLDLLFQSDGWKIRIENIIALLLPSFLVVPVLIPYFASRLSYYRLDEKGWQSEAGSTLLANLADVLHSWFIQANADFLYNRQGPIINAILLPLCVLGIVIAVFTFRNQFSRWMLLWAGLFLLPVPILTGSPFGRIYYPALPAVYALIALSLYLLGWEVFRFLGSRLRTLGYLFGILILVWLPLLNFYIYFNEVADPTDRLIRSDIGELAQQAAGPQSYLYLSYYSDALDPLFYEEHIVKLGLRQKLPVNEIPNSYERILYKNLLPTLLSREDDGKTIEILIDKEYLQNFGYREQIVETLLRCFPEGILHEGNYFSRYSLEPSALLDPACLPVQAFLSLPEGEKKIDGNQPQKLIWSLSSGKASGLHLLCAQGRTEVIRIEGEDFSFGYGWKQDVAYVDGWKGDGYLVDSINSNYASTLVRLPIEALDSESVFVWVRYYKRVVDGSPAYIILDDQFLAFAENDDINEWVWERVGPFYPEHDLAEWKIFRPYQDDSYQFSALFIDSVVFTTEPQFSPEHENSWDPTLIADYSFRMPAQEGEIEFNLSPGRYSCLLEIESELPLVDALGQTPVKSNIMELIILE